MLVHDEGGELRWAGKVGTGIGWNAKFLGDLRKHFDALAVEASPFNPPVSTIVFWPVRLPALGAPAQTGYQAAAAESPNFRQKKEIDQKSDDRRIPTGQMFPTSVAAPLARWLARRYGDGNLGLRDKCRRC